MVGRESDLAPPATLPCRGWRWILLRHPSGSAVRKDFDGRGLAGRVQLRLTPSWVRVRRNDQKSVRPVACPEVNRPPFPPEAGSGARKDCHLDLGDLGI